MEYHDQDLTKVASIFLGGPLDGARFAMPCSPVDASVPERATVPLKQPAESSPLAVYVRSGEDAVDGYYVYFFEDCLSPDGSRLLYAAPGAATDPDPVVPSNGFASSCDPKVDTAST